MQANRLLFLTLLITQFSAAFAQGVDLIYGTQSVSFQPIKSRGELISCSLVYQAVQPDYAYSKGDPVFITGNIGILLSDGIMALTLKIGSKNLNSPKDSFSRPYFAYLQTNSITTAKSKYSARDGDDGFKLIVIDFNENSAKLIEEMLDSGSIIIGYNLRKNGTDVLFPVDLRVSETKYIRSENVVRKKTDDAIIKFVSCYEQLLTQQIKSLEHN